MSPQYWKILDRPLLYYTLEVFDQLPWISLIVVAVSPEHVAPMQNLADTAWGLRRVRFVAGSTTRHRSIAAGVEYLRAEAAREPAVRPDVVIVHDAV